VNNFVAFKTANLQNYSPTLIPTQLIDLKGFSYVNYNFV